MLLACQGRESFSRRPREYTKNLPSCAILALACKTFNRIYGGETGIMADAMADAMANDSWQEVELQQIGTYTNTRLLSTGPANSLYIGKQRKKEIIIKVFHPPLITLEAKEAFLARAKQLKKLKHRYIIDIQDYGFTQHTQDTQDTSEDYAYIVMQFVPAGTVRQNISPGQCLRSDEVKRMLSPLASALHYAHVSNILHGNLHPGNLLVDTNNDILLTDFSLPLQGAFPSPDDAALAIPYMAPEQLQGTLMAASDQYSLAVMVYEWLCGRRPYEATGREKLLHQQEHDPLPTLGSLNADISPAIEHVLLQALAHNPGERFQHTQAFADNYLRALMGLPLNIETRNIGSPIPTPSTSIDNNTKATKGSEKAAHIAHSVQFVAPSSSPIVPSVDTPAANIGSDIDPVHNATTEDSTFYDPKAENGEESRRNPPAKFATPIGGSQLHDNVIADLCQGGILSQSLPGYEERPAQIEMATLVAHSLMQDTPTIIEAGTGTGKALDVDTPIPTPTGWKRMGDLAEGDVVFDEKGHPTPVTAAFDAMYHHKCYEVVFSDGSSLIADAEHEWVSYTCADRKWANSSRTDTYVAKNFVTSDQLVILDRLIALSENDNTLSVDGAVALIGGHHWSVYQAASKIAPINSKERPARYPHQALLTAVRGRLARDLGEQRRDGRTYSLVTTEKM